MKPRYPVYIPTKGRYARGDALTIRCLLRDEVDFHAVVEPAEVSAYSQLIQDDSKILVLPEDSFGLMRARRWIFERASEAGTPRHWQLDDNMRGFRRLHRGKRLPCRAGVALRVVEDFTDRYTNVAISGLNYTMFVPSHASKPFVVNCHVYSCALYRNELPFRPRLIYNDDTDMCLQVIAGGYCTLLVSAFSVDKARTMVHGGGNTDDLYQEDGRLLMARMLERQWPGVVRTGRRFGRAQHFVAHEWKRFKGKLIPKEGLEPESYDLRVTKVAEPKSDEIRRIADGG